MDCPSPLLKTVMGTSGIVPSSVHLRSSPLSVTTNLSDEEDRISALPDHILIDILERVDDLRTVVQASTLSRRWAHLPRSLSYLCIQIADFLPRDPSRRKHWKVNQGMTAYPAAVRSLLKQSPSCNRVIKYLDLVFYLKDPYMAYIGHAVGDVVKHGNTDFLQFVIYSEVQDPSYEQCVMFGQRFMSFVQACPVAFIWITRLILQNITFGDREVSTVLDACRKLELLSLDLCVCVIDPVTSEETVLTIDAPDSSLLALSITTCAYARIDLIQVPKLEMLLYTNWNGANPPFRFGKVPCLGRISLSCAALHWQNPFALSHFLPNTTTLTKMHLDFADQMIWIKPEGPKHLSTTFSNLRDVNLYNIFYECDLNWTMFVLEAAPSLSNFRLKLSCHPCERNRCEDCAEKVNVVWDHASPDFEHHRLSLLQMVGFAVDEKLMKYIRLVMKRAVGLRRICLLDQRPCAECDAMNNAQPPSPMRWRFPADEDEKKLIRQQLVDGFSSSVEISIG
ncbi:unnamed protein product [Urochloa decumbens]|uniref:At1g61320/AtMIF1 LRR domain-containing protein n=1 Tax=Urochloa decumbens TaxID=240449 RepID=A0ABC9GME5_9POAL